MSDTVRWSVLVSKETDLALRTYLTQQGLGPEEFSQFIEDAVQWRVLDRTVAETKAQNVGEDPAEIEAALEEAVQAVRSERFRVES
jgi:Ribbon-helix-helix domain